MHEVVFHEKIKDLSIELVDEYKGWDTPIEFRCTTCGHEWTTRPTNITAGGSGCHLCAKTPKGINNILADHGEWLEIDVSTKKHPHAIMKIDKEDWEVLKVLMRGRVSPIKPGKITYAVCKALGKTTRIHRIVMRMPPDDVDHINHDGLDNRKCNLRLATRSQNNMNTRISNNNTRTGVKGVRVSSYNPAGKKWKSWEAHIVVDRKKIRIGTFRSFEQAVQARLDAELKYHGEFAYNEARESLDKQGIEYKVTP